MQRRAQGMMFVPGADWSEATVGTSAPGTALALGRGLQISGAEHYKRSVHPWSCTAVPFHDPDSGALLGVVDITGTESAEKILSFIDIGKQEGAKLLTGGARAALDGDLAGG